MIRWAPDPGRQRPRIGIDPFDPGYGVGYQVEDDSSYQHLECDLVEDDGEFRVHQPEVADRPSRLAFVDGTMRIDARLTLYDPDYGNVAGVAGTWAAGAAVVDLERPIEVARTCVGRNAIFGNGRNVGRLQAGKWLWESIAVEGSDLAEPSRRLQGVMREAETDVAKELVQDGWFTIVDGPLRRLSTGTEPVVGYVKTHHRRLLEDGAWRRVPELQPGERSGVFAIKDRTYGSYLRVGDAGPWSSPWAGIVRIEVPQSVGRIDGVKLLDRAAAWLPRFASPLHRDARAPVNLTPIAGLERHLRHLHGDSSLAIRAIRQAVDAIAMSGT